MTRSELDHHAKTLLEMGEGLVDLNTSVWEFADDYHTFLDCLGGHLDAEQRRIAPLREKARQQEARYEPDYRF